MKITNFTNDNTPDGINLEGIERNVPLGFEVLSVDTKNNIFVISNSHIYKYDGSEWLDLTDNELCMGQEPSSVLCDNNGYTWIQFDNGIGRIDGDSLVYYNNRDGLEDSPNQAMRVDPDGNVWVLGFGSTSVFDGETWSEGIEGFEPDTYHFEIHNETRTIWIPGESFIFSNVPLCSYNLDEKVLVDCDLAEDIQSIDHVAFAPDGTVWIASFGNGLEYVGNLQHMHNILFFHHQKGSDIHGDSGGQLFVDSKNRVWIAPYSGFAHTLMFDGELVHDFWDIQYTQIIEAKDVIWCATDSGLSMYDGKTWKTITEKDGLSGTVVEAICADNEGCIWAATEKGLSKLEP